MRYRFRVSAHTEMGESLVLVGSLPELGNWDPQRGQRMQTSASHYPIWWVDLSLPEHPADLATSLNNQLDYQYVRLRSSNSHTDPVQWEALGTNRWIPLKVDQGLAPSPEALLVIEDGVFGRVSAWPHGYFVDQQPRVYPLTPSGLKILVMGSSVALGCSAWLLQGWAADLAERLHQRFGHQLVNRSQLGSTVHSTLQQLPQQLALETPDMVIIALSLGNEGFAHCSPHQRRAIQRRFESGLLQLVKMTREAGAIPILGGIYPHADYTPEHNALLQETQQRMLSWGIPVLNWLEALNNGYGGWKAGLSFDVAHPNSQGHRRMAAAIDLTLFDQQRADFLQKVPPINGSVEIPVFQDSVGFQVSVNPQENSIRVLNPSPYPYDLNPNWSELQAALTLTPTLLPGLYISTQAAQDSLPYFSLRSDRSLETTLQIPPYADLRYRPLWHSFAPQTCEILFYDGQLGILKESATQIRVVNESEHVYSLHPMWSEVRSACRGIPPGVYQDPWDPQAPFRTLMVGGEGLESRVKIPAKSSLVFRYQCPLSAIQRVAIVPLGDRCAVRMMLYKMDYDGPAFPFDLSRTTHLSDVADIIATGFSDMWNPNLLEYSSEAGRIYHRRWHGLSFAHEVEASEDPLQNMEPIFQRMRQRYQARSKRFWYTLRHADQLLFIRTGVTLRGYVEDLLEKLQTSCQGKPFQLLILSPQSSQEFAGLPQVIHHNQEFNPDRMYADGEHWMYCTQVMQGILNQLGVSTQNLFWCPPTPPS